MAYCTQNEVEMAAGGRTNLAQLTMLPDGTGAPVGPLQVNPDVLAQAIADADAWIDSYVGKVRAVPLAPVPPVIRRISAEEAVYLLRSRRLFPEIDQAKHDANTRWLEGVARGAVSLGVEPAPPKSELIQPAVVLIGELRAHGERLRGLW